MILSRITRFLRINELMDKFDRSLKEYSLSYAHIIIDDKLSTILYGDNSHSGEPIHLLELKDLLEPDMSYKSFRSKL